MILIGEKINASLRRVRDLVRNRDQAGLIGLAGEQASAGADYIDVNVGTGLGSREDEVAAMQWAVATIQNELEIPLSLDSADAAVLDAALKVRDGRASLINSTKAEEESLQEVLPLAERYDTPIVALAMDETGIPRTVEDRLNACQKIVAACGPLDIPQDRIFFDPLVLPVSTDIQQGMVTLQTIMKVKQRFPGAKTVIGLSNVSYGLPQRARLNAAFLHMAVFAGLDAAIMDPLDAELTAAVKAAEVLVGKDRRCRRYLRAFRR
jgi:cobalamin-dependent methionine synthase I